MERKTPDAAVVLAEIAETASETLELQQVFDRVAASIRKLVPCDHVGVVRVLDGRHAVMHATTFDCAPPDGRCSEPQPLLAWSPRFRPRPGPIPRLDDAKSELDRTFPVDQGVLDSGIRSALWEPFRGGETWRGGLLLTSQAPAAFTDEHQRLLAPVAAILGSGVE